MSAGTVNGIRDSLESTIAKLSPTGRAKGRRRFRRASKRLSEWEDKPGSDIDREFSIEEISRGDNLTFGSTSANDYNGEILLTVGHSKTGDLKEAEKRRDTDLHLIAATMEKSVSLPTGCNLIRLASWSVDEIDKFWISTLIFRTVYTLVVPS